MHLDALSGLQASGRERRRRKERRSPRGRPNRRDIPSPSLLRRRPNCHLPTGNKHHQRRHNLTPAPSPRRISRTLDRRVACTRAVVKSLRASINDNNERTGKPRKRGDHPFAPARFLPALVKMSNANVGAVYEHIIDEVINTVRVDFEEGGVGEDILEELKKVSACRISLSSSPLCFRSLALGLCPQPIPFSFSPASLYRQNGMNADFSRSMRHSCSSAASAGALVWIVGDASAALAGSLDGGGAESSSFWGDGRASRYLGLFLSSRRVC